MVSGEHFLEPILAHDIFLIAAWKKPAFLANVGYEGVEPLTLTQSHNQGGRS